MRPKRYVCIFELLKFILFTWFSFCKDVLYRNITDNITTAQCTAGVQAPKWIFSSASSIILASRKMIKFYELNN